MLWVGWFGLFMVALLLVFVLLHIGCFGVFGVCLRCGLVFVGVAVGLVRAEFVGVVDLVDFWRCGCLLCVLIVLWGLTWLGLVVD